jgi:membrane protein implicated in regulation of membrane protease activity
MGIVVALKFIAVPIAILGMFFVVTNAIEGWEDAAKGGIVLLNQVNVIIEAVMWSVISVVPFVLSRTAKRVKKIKKEIK